MDTKLKKYRYSAWFKLFAIVLCIAGMLTLAYGLLKAPYFEVAVQNTDFKESMSSKNMLDQTYNSLSYIAFSYKNEKNIKSGGALDDEFNNRTSNLLIDKENELQEIENVYKDAIQQTSTGEVSIEDEPSTKTIFTYPEVATEDKTVAPTQNPADTNVSPEMNTEQKRIELIKAQKNSQIVELNKKYDTLIKNVKTDYINEQLSDFRMKSAYLNSQKGILYTVVEGDKSTLSNLTDSSSAEAYYKNLPYYVKISPDNINSVFSNYSYNYSSLEKPPENFVVYVGISQEKYDAELATFTENSKEGLWGIKICSIGLLAFLIGLIYLIYAAGRRVDKDGVHLTTVDQVYLDVALAISVAAIALCLAPFFEFGQYLFEEKKYLNNDLILVVFGIIIAIGTLIGILFVTMFSKRLKRHEVIKHTLIFYVCSWIISKIKSIYAALYSVFDTSPLAMRLVLIFGAYAVITLISILLLFAGPIGVFGFLGIVGVNFFAIYFLLKIFKTLNDIKNGAERIRAGELSYNIPVKGVLELRQLSDTINKIADGLKNAVSSQVKAEHMKAELITNVSHDLKTPLTSIITYVDLLKNEGLQSENADKYLGIIDAKSQRLKSLTEDLFEAAKVTSGSVSVNTQRIDVVSLISQGLGELSDKIEASGLTFRTNLKSDKLFVFADGKLLWRVIENLLSNVFKYALPNSRVYIDAAAYGEKVSIIIKNISAYELNVNEDELMERFKRGDASRHSEGSGLGLSIAKSLTELQGGNFSIDIDGDLFKATIILQKASEE